MFKVKPKDFHLHTQFKLISNIQILINNKRMTEIQKKINGFFGNNIVTRSNSTIQKQDLIFKRIKKKVLKQVHNNIT